MNKIQDLIDSYKLKRNSYITDKNLSKNSNNEDKFIKNTNKFFNEKWQNRIPTGWYGWDLGWNTPHFFFNVIDEFLEYVEKECPTFEIHQIKTKYGGLRIYLGNVSNEISKEIDQLQNILFEEGLKY